jgi:hypothetical protein
VKGGRRPGAGRPAGSKNRVRHEAKERLRRLLDPVEAGLVKKLLLSGDQRVALETLRLVWSITDPQPRPSVGIVHSAPALQEFLERLALRRLSEGTSPALSGACDPPGVEHVDPVVDVDVVGVRGAVSGAENGPDSSDTSSDTSPEGPKTGGSE